MAYNARQIIVTGIIYMPIIAATVLMQQFSECRLQNEYTTAQVKWKNNFSIHNLIQYSYHCAAWLCMYSTKKSVTNEL